MTQTAVDSELRGINNSGDILGQYWVDGIGYDFLYGMGCFTTFDVLGTPLPPPSGGATGIMTWSYGINDRGDIVGLVFGLGERFLASVPEPFTILLLGSGLIGLWGLRRKFKK